MSYFSLDDNRKIGIGLSTAGLLFTVLGIFMFFDRGLLAMGNVRTQHKSKHGGSAQSKCAHIRTANSLALNKTPSNAAPFQILVRAAALPLRRDAHHRADEDLPLLLPEAEGEGHRVLPRRHRARALRMGDDRHHRRRMGLPQPLWRLFSDGAVRCACEHTHTQLSARAHSTIVHAFSLCFSHDAR